MSLLRLACNYSRISRLVTFAILLAPLRFPEQLPTVIAKDIFGAEVDKNRPTGQLPLEDNELEKPIVSDSFQSALSSTAQAFTHRIQRKIQEQEQSNILAEEASKLRHNTLLNALLDIRRALTDVTRINLGKRFKFVLIADDSNGWPRLTVNLLDQVMRAAHYPTLQVTAHDRNQLAVIEIKFDASRPAEQISLANEENLPRASQLLKKSVRSYLDIIAEMIIQAELNSVDSIDNKNLIDSRVTSAILSVTQDAKQEHNFFAENLEEVLESLPELDSVTSLTLDEEF